MAGKFRRRKIVIDKQFQFHYMLVWTIISVGIVFLAWGAVYTAMDRMKEAKNPAEQILDPREADFQLRLKGERAATFRYLMWINGAYILTMSVIMGVYTVIHSHRIAGPAYRLRKTLEGFRRREFGMPVSLRKKDYFKDVAAEMEAFRARLVEDRKGIAEAIERLRQSGDAETRETADRLAERLDLDRPAAEDSPPS